MENKYIKILKECIESLESKHGSNTEYDAGFVGGIQHAINIIILHSTKEYCCHCDLEEGQEPDACVIDRGDYEDCIYAKRGMRKEQCKYWQVVK